MKVLIIDNGTKHLGRLRDLLFGNEIKIIPLLSKYSDSDAAGYDLIILSGGSQFSSVGIPELFKDETKLIKESTTPIIGICQGCEIIATAFGSELIFVERKEKGLKKISVLTNKELFGGNIFFEAYEAHHFSIANLGKDLSGMARSKYGFEVIKHKTKKIYGLQFHPEMLTDYSLGDDIFRRIVFEITN